MGFKTLILALLLFCKILVGCSDLPQREKFPGGQGRTTDMQRVESQKQMLGGFDSLNNPIGSTNDASIRAGKSLKGVVSIKNGEKLPQNYHLFISVRPVKGGPPIAAKRLQGPTFPYKFEITESDKIAMGGMMDRPFDGFVEIVARVDQDGDPLSRSPGDLRAGVQTSIPAENLDLTLEKE